MSQHPLESVAHELHEALESGALARLGRVALSDGVAVDPERMARIILADVERSARGQRSAWLTEDEEQKLTDDLLCLLTLARRGHTQAAHARSTLGSGHHQHHAGSGMASSSSD